MSTTTGMKGGGYYNAHSDEQRAALNAFLPWIEEAIADLPLPPGSGQPIRILDIGSSEGGNAIHAMMRLIEAVRQRTDAPIWLFFDDLPTNDFNQLFANLFRSGSLVIPGADIFPAVIGGTAFGRMVPPQSLHLVTTFNTVAFLETMPNAKIPGYILAMSPHATRDGVSVSAAEREPFRLQAEHDLRQFYRARAEELIRGGKLLVEVFGRDEDHSTSDGIYDVLSDALLDAVEDNLLPRKIYQDLVFPVCFRSLEELLAPLEAADEIGKAFRIEKAEARETPVHFNVARDSSGDTTAWARSYAAFLRAFTEPILIAAIPDELVESGIVSEIYRRIEVGLAANPGRYDFHYIALGALLTRL